MAEKRGRNRLGGAGHLLLAAVMLLGLGFGAGPGAVTAGESPNSAASGPMYKVIAAPGLLDPEAEGVTLWHDYGSFAL